MQLSMLANLLRLVSGMALHSLSWWGKRRYPHGPGGCNTSHSVAGQPKSRGRPRTGLAAQNQLAKRNKFFLKHDPARFNWHEI